MSVINTNVNAIIAQNAGVKNERLQTTAMQRLSTGTRINSSADDAAGLAISSKMTSQIRGLNQAVRNANDGISLIQTAEGALTEVTNMLQRMRELAVQSASDTNTSSDRTALNAEFVALRDEINRIGNNTEFNGMKVLDKSFDSGSGTFVFQVGANGAQTIDITMGDYRTSNAVTTGITATSATTGGAQTSTWTAAGALTANESVNFTVDGTLVTFTNGSTATADAKATATAISGSSTFQAAIESALGLSSGDITLSDDGNGVLSVTGPAGTTFTLGKGDTLNSGTLGAVSFTATQQTDTIAFADQTYTEGDVISIDIGGASFRHAVTATVTTGQALAEQIEGSAAFSTWASGQGLTFTDATDANLVLIGGSNQSFTTTATNNQAAGDMNMINASSITTQAASNAAVSAVDSAIAVVSGGRATMGATINRLNYAADNLLATSANVSASRSRVLDTDYSSETTELARTQIIQQASTAMLAQANQSAQSVLSLLK